MRLLPLSAGNSTFLGTMTLTFLITANGPIINYLDINRCESVGAIIKDRVESPLYTFPDNPKQGLLTLQDNFSKRAQKFGWIVWKIVSVFYRSIVCCDSSAWRSHEPLSDALIHRVSSNQGEVLICEIWYMYFNNQIILRLYLEKEQISKGCNMHYKSIGCKSIIENAYDR